MLKVGSEIIDISQGGSTYFNKIYQGEDLLWEYDNDINSDVIYYTTQKGEKISDEAFTEATGVDLLYNKLDGRTGKFKVKFANRVFRIGDNFLNYDTSSPYILPSGEEIELAEEDVKIVDGKPTIDVPSISRARGIQGGINFLPSDGGIVVLSTKNYLLDIEFQGFEYLTEIGSNFLSRQYNLTDIGIDGLSKVETVGDSFLAWCQALKSIDLNKFENLNTIGTYFCHSLEKVSEIDLSIFKKNNIIPKDYFLNYIGYYTDMETIDLSPLDYLTKLPHNFIADLNIKYIDLSPLRNVTSIGGHFPSGWHKVTKIDLTPLENVSSWVAVWGVDAFINLESLEELDLYPLKKMTNWRTPTYMINNCGMRELDITPLTETNLGGINNACIVQNCKNLESIIIRESRRGVMPDLFSTYGLLQIPENIYVPDDLLEGFKTKVSKYADRFKPLSEYKPKEI